MSVQHATPQLSAHLKTDSYLNAVSFFTKKNKTKTSCGSSNSSTHCNATLIDHGYLLPKYMHLFEYYSQNPCCWCVMMMCESSSNLGHLSTSNAAITCFCCALLLLNSARKSNMKKYIYLFYFRNCAAKNVAINFSHWCAHTKSLAIASLKDCLVHQ